MFLLLVPALLSLWGCSRYQIQHTIEAYSHKPGFELKVIHADSLSFDNENVSKVLSYLKGVKEVYILNFNSAKGNSAENKELCDKLEKYVNSAHFENLVKVEGKKDLVALYLKKDNEGNIDQVIFMKSGGKHSVYIWAPHSKT